MAFLDLIKKKKELPHDIDLDLPPEPPGMMKEEISTESPIDEEMIPLEPKKSKIKFPKLKKEKKLPEIPPLPKMEEELPPMPEEGGLPSLPEEHGEFEKLPDLDMSHEESPLSAEGGLDLPPPPNIGVKKKGFFSFLKPKKTEELALPKIGGKVPEMPPLPEEHGEFPDMPPMHEDIPPEPEKAPSVPPLHEISAPKPLEMKKVISKVKEEKHVTVKKQKFITIDEFRQIQESISTTKSALKAMDSFFGKLDDVKSDEDEECVGLSISLKDIQRKIMFVDKILFKEEV